MHRNDTEKLGRQIEGGCSDILRYSFRVASESRTQAQLESLTVHRAYAPKGDIL